MIRIGFDIGGVLSKYPDILRPIVCALLNSQDIEVHVLSDMHPHERCVALVHDNGFPIPAEWIHSCNFAALGEECKATKATALGLHVLVDDFPGYLACVGEPPLRLLAMPDPARDYYHPDWKTDGSEGNFGRIIQRRK